MINPSDLAKALINEAKIITDANSITLVTSDGKTEDGERFSPDVNDPYVQEFVLFGDDTSVGLANDSSDIQIGIYQLSIHSPKTKSKFIGLDIAVLLKNHFVRGLEPTFNGQKAVVIVSSLSGLMPTETFNVYHLSITFSVIN